MGPGLDEVFYHDMLKERLRAAGIPFESKPRAKLLHRGIVADEFEADFLIGRELILELKALRGDFDAEHLLQIICYLKFWKLPAGLLFDFGKESLLHKRVAFTAPEWSFDPEAFCAAAPAESDPSLIEQLGRSLEFVLREHGLGYRDTTYRGLLAAELEAEGLNPARDCEAPVRDGTSFLGQIRLDSLVVSGQTAIRVVALRDSFQAADRAVLQTHLRLLGLPWGLAVNFGKRSIRYEFVRRLRNSCPTNPR